MREPNDPQFPSHSTVSCQQLKSVTMISVRAVIIPYSVFYSLQADFIQINSPITKSMQHEEARQGLSTLFKIGQTNSERMRLMTEPHLLVGQFTGYKRSHKWTYSCLLPLCGQTEARYATPRWHSGLGLMTCPSLGYTLRQTQLSLEQEGG